MKCEKKLFVSKLFPLKIFLLCGLFICSFACKQAPKYAKKTGGSLTKKFAKMQNNSDRPMVPPGKRASGKSFKGIKPLTIEQLDKDGLKALGAEKLDAELLFKSKKGEFEFKIPKDYFILKNLMNDTVLLMAKKRHYTIAVKRLPYEQGVSLKDNWLRHMKENFKKINMPSIGKNISITPFGPKQEGKKRFEYSYSTPLSSVSGLIDMYHPGGSHIYCVRIECGYCTNNVYLTEFIELLDEHFKLN